MFKMNICQLCGREFKSERGLFIHLSRIHGVRGIHGRFSLMVFHQFFHLLRRKRWSNAKNFLRKAKEKNSEDEWMNDYLNALEGMVIALSLEHSVPRPYIIEVNSFDQNRLQSVQKDLLNLFERPVKTSFDSGYFQAWLEYINYLMLQKKEANKDAKSQQQLK